MGKYNEKEKAKLESQLDLSVLKLVIRNEFDEITEESMVAQIRLFTNL